MQLIKTAATPKKVVLEKKASHPVKLTSLRCLEEALHLEQYEECLRMIHIASEFGASHQEIKNVISSYVRHDRSDFWELGES